MISFWLNFSLYIANEFFFVFYNVTNILCA